MLAGIIAFIVAVSTLTAWLYSTRETARETRLLFNLFQTEVRNDIDKMKADQRELRDTQIRQDTQLGAVMTVIGKWDRIEKIDANTEATKDDVAELKREVIPREALEARFKAIEDRLP
jgi:hypothetical protein